MGYFTEFNQTGVVTNPSNDNTNDTITYPSTANVSMHIIRQDPSEQSILGEQVSTHETNVDGDVTASIKQGAKIVWASKNYKVVNEPEYLPLVKKTKILLIRIHS